MMNDILHVYGQAYWHDTMVIDGTVEGLEKLKKALAEAIKFGEGKSVAFVNDGESFSIVVRRVDLSHVHALPVPYWDEIAREQAKGKR